jgi:hypothetical protein
MSKTVEGLTFTVEFNQYVLIKSKIAKESSGEWCNIKTIKS